MNGSLPPNNESVSQHNRRAWDQLAQHHQRFTRAASDSEFIDPLALLDGNGWLAEGIRGKSMLCLAAGGGRQGPLYAAAGAQVTVVDISGAQLERDREVAAARRLSLQTVQTSMDDLSMFRTAEFQLVIHPVSTCYLPNIRAVYAEIARVTAPNGLYISQHKQPTSLQTQVAPEATGGYLISEPYYRVEPLPPVHGSLHRESGTLEFLHRWEELLGAMCRAGFTMEDLVEPCHAKSTAESGTFAHRSQFVPPYVRVKARRRADHGGQRSSILV